MDPQTEPDFQRALDPFADTQMFPMHWDLSELPPAPKTEAIQPAQMAAPTHSDDHGLEPGAFDDWHLGEYFDRRLSRHRLGCPAY